MGDLTLVKIGKAYVEANKNKGCDVCGRKMKYIYFLGNQIITTVCGYHKLKSRKTK
jgi:hypothetical protein